MVVTIVILSLLVVLLLWALCRKSFQNSGDDRKILENRLALQECAAKDYDNGLISKDVYRHLTFFFHPDFKNI